MYILSHTTGNIDVQFFSINQRITHYSQDLHFYMVLSGSIIIHYPDEPFTLHKDDIIVLLPGISYEADALGDNSLLEVSFSCNLFRDLSIEPNSIICNSANYKKKNYIKLKELLKDLTIYYNANNCSHSLMASIYQIAAEVNTHFTLHENPANKQRRKDHITERIHAIKAYINANYQYLITLQTLADKMFLTPQYLSRFMKQHFGQSFLKYLNQTRLDHAIPELLNTRHSMTTIAFNNGFPNSAAFNKSFKTQYGINPSQYRQNHLETKATPNEKVILSYKLEDIIKNKNSDDMPELFDTYSHTRHLSINVTQHSPLATPYLDAINVGFATDLLSQVFQKQFLDCQKQIHFKYVRIQNILSSEIIHPIKDSRNFDFTNLNDILDFFLKSQAIPQIELSMKPIANSVQVNKDGLPFYAINENEDIYTLDYCQTVLRAMLIHCINRYGIQYVSKWRFELWAVHDESLVYTEFPSAYAYRFKCYREVIKQHVPDAHIGGPGYNTCSASHLFEAYLSSLKEQRIVPDYISIYLFSFDSTRYNIRLKDVSRSLVSVLSMNPEIFKERVTAYKQSIIKIFDKSLPLHVSEYNSCIQGYTFIMNSAYQAAFLCKTALDLQDDVDCLNYWLFTDLMNAYANYDYNNTKDTTGAGLIDFFGIKKPVFFAHYFLSMMGQSLIEKGDNYMVTSNSSSAFQILAFHYQHFNKDFCIHFSHNLNIENTYDIYEEVRPLKMEIKFSNIHPGKYKISKYILNRSYGSALDEFLSIIQKGNSTPHDLIYTLLNMQQQEIDYYQSVCVPKLEIYYMDCREGMTFSLELGPHEVNFIEISRKL